MVSDSPQENPAAAWWSLAAIILCIAVATFAVWRILGTPLFGCDDANIFFIYARNFAHGNGIVYNAGGQHVEGFSSILYFLCCSAAYLVSARPELALFWLNVLFCIATNLVLAFVIRRFAAICQLSRIQTVLLGLAYLLWLAINPAYFAWNIVSLMDVGLYTLAITLNYAFLATLLLRDTIPALREALQLSALAILLLLTRPEGIAWALVAITIFAVVAWLRLASFSGALRAAAVPLLAVDAAVEIFRLKYFGYLLPNTFYAKVSASLPQTFHDGSRYLLGFIRLYGIVSIAPVMLGIGGVVYVLYRNEHTDNAFPVVTLTLLFAAVGLAFPVLEGGDHFRDFRMYQSIYPILGFLFLLPAMYFLRLKEWTNAAIYSAAMLIFAIFTWNGSWTRFSQHNQLQGLTNTQMRVRVEFLIASQGRRRGNRLNQLFPTHSPSIGVFEAGGNAYAYNGVTYDLMGLNDPRMAHADKIKTGPKGHQSFNKDVFYSLAPDILLPETVLPTYAIHLNTVDTFYRDPDGFENQAFKNIFADPQFRAAYSLVAMRNIAVPAFVCYGYFRNTYLTALTATGQYVVVDRLPTPLPAA